MDPRQIVRALAAELSPGEPIERRHQAELLAWIDSGASLFRVAKPATPPQHLVVYFVLLDDIDQSILVGDHRKSGARLPPGGHVDVGEHPVAAVVREALEELGIAARFHDLTGDRPFFLSITPTRGPDSHLDVTLWFILAASRDEELRPDPREFAGIDWLPLRSTDWSAEHFDPQMARFSAKLIVALDG